MVILSISKWCDMLLPTCQAGGIKEHTVCCTLPFPQDGRSISSLTEQIPAPPEPKIKAASAHCPATQGQHLSLQAGPREPAQPVPWDTRMKGFLLSRTCRQAAFQLCVIWARQHWALARLSQQGWRKSRCAELIYTVCWYSPKLLAIKWLSHSWLKDKLLTAWKCCKSWCQ